MITHVEHEVRTKRHNVYKVPSIMSFTEMPHILLLTQNIVRIKLGNVYIIFLVQKYYRSKNFMTLRTETMALNITQLM